MLPGPCDLTDTECGGLTVDNSAHVAFNNDGFDGWIINRKQYEPVDSYWKSTLILHYIRNIA